ncbi:MAG: hypothetical protein UU23_C0003G0029 [Candidatus Curtissbacteria bacterium GW2011_GWA1_40_9]|uniref:Uncharacterized protein n=1 Tax=Candidatus Curtissbacteria bacterium GW2011_GWA1_40_9 TaxID=1618408 RepID=A0A0G0TTG4_9BACT|nr:MAG: hypothetical protein UU23_C0003G0029 [Candidatus Curtissbacteria bacterium GW2011_GWA1_40_9]
MSKEQKFISQELRFEFEDNEILHIDNGSIKIHTALAKDQFGIERIYHKLINEQKVQPESIVSHLVGNQILVIAARGVEIFLHQRDEEDKQVPANSLELWNLEKPYITGNQSDAVYVAKFQGDDMTFLVQYLHPNSVSSHHRHHKATEHFFSPCGTEHGYIWLNQYKTIPIIGHRAIGPEDPHMVFALSKPVVSFILQNTDEFEHDPTGLERASIEFLNSQVVDAGLYPIT